MKIKLTNIVPFIFVWLWSTGFVTAKLGLPYIEPFFMILIRFLLVIAIFYVMVTLLNSHRVNQTQALQQIVVGMLIHGGYLGGVFFAIDRGMPAGITAILVGLQPIVTSIAGWMFLNEKLNLKQITGLLIGFVGISLILLDNSQVGSSELSYVGIISCLVALFCISLGTILQSRYAQKSPLISGTLYQFVGAVLIVGIMTFLLEDQTVTFHLNLVLSMTWLVFGLSIAAILLLMYMIREGEVAKVSSYFYLVSPVAVFQAWLYFDEQLGLQSILGATLAVVGVYLVHRKTAGKKIIDIESAAASS